MNLKNILLICLFICSLITLKAQETNDSGSRRTPNKFKDKITFNMSGGVTFGTVTNISLLPQIGYKIKPRWIAGVGANLHYFKVSNSSTEPLIFFGGNAFTRYHLLPNLFVQTEYQKIQYLEFWNDYLMVGGGYVDPIGLTLSAYYVLIQPTNRSAYNSPFLFRIGYNLNL